MAVPRIAVTKKATNQRSCLVMFIYRNRSWKGQSIIAILTIDVLGSCFSFCRKVYKNQHPPFAAALTRSSGPLAQSVERFHGMEEVTGSIPVRSTILQLLVQKNLDTLGFNLISSFLSRNLSGSTKLFKSSRFSEIDEL